MLITTELSCLQKNNFGQTTARFFCCWSGCGFWGVRGYCGVSCGQAACFGLRKKGQRMSWDHAICDYTCACETYFEIGLTHTHTLSTHTHLVHTRACKCVTCGDKAGWVCDQNIGRNSYFEKRLMPSCMLGHCMHRMPASTRSNSLLRWMYVVLQMC